MNTITDLFGLPRDALSIPSAPNAFGIECEIESVDNYSSVDPEVWETKPDGSLRNNGVEFVSRPVTLEEAVAAFEQLHSSLTLRNSSMKFSPRTSIHVHVNCKNQTPEQTKNLLLYYALFEEVIFSLVEPSRRDNIHCVALNDTHLPARYSQDIPNLHAAWSKYTAFNIKPLASYGTVEFRHSHGHDSLRQFTQWITVLDKLVTLAKTTPITPASLEREEVGRWFDTVFGHCESYPDLKVHFPAMIENSLIDIKLSFI